MVYFIRAKSYFKYASDLLESLKNNSKELSEEEFFKKSKDVAFISLKALWALSQITPPEKPPTLEEVLNAALKCFTSEKASFVKKFVNEIINQKGDKNKILSSLQDLLELVKEELKPIL